MANLSSYTSKEIKDTNYVQCIYVDTQQDLDAAIQSIRAHETDFLYRGIYDASYQMYTSSQRLWIQGQPRMKRLGIPDYHNTIQMLINLTYSLSEVKQYMQQQNIDYNEFFIMALMQHFGAPAPMLDFSNTLFKGLFFSVDNMPQWTDTGSNNLDDYISLYYIPRNIDWVDCTIQKVMESAAQNIERMINDYQQNHHSMPNTVAVENDIRYLLYRQFHPSLSNISFLPVGGPNTGIVNINIPVLGFQCNYQIINSRLVSQDGMFVFNNTDDIPLVELMNQVCRTKYFYCLNIRKNLVPYIHSNYLLPQNVTHNSIYCIGDPVSDGLQQAIGKV